MKKFNIALKTFETLMCKLTSGLKKYFFSKNKRKWRQFSSKRGKTHKKCDICHIPVLYKRVQNSSETLQFVADNQFYN